MLSYLLIENNLTDCPDDYSAQAHAMARLDKEAFITRMFSMYIQFKTTTINILIINKF